MANIFIDCGSNVGQGIRAFAAMYQMDSSWRIETFEPNPHLIDALKASISGMPMNITIHNKAVWDQNGEVEFSIMAEEPEGSSVNKLMNNGVCANPNSPSYRKHDNIVRSPCVNISDVLNECAGNRVILKLDIEGSEFCVIRKMLSDDTISLVSEIYVEWHTQYMSSESSETEQELIRLVSAKGILIHPWH